MTTIPQRQSAAIIADRVQAHRRQLAQMRDAIVRIDRLIAPAVIAMETRNDGWPERRGAGGSSSGVSNPVLAQTIAIDHVLELDSQMRLMFVTALEALSNLEPKLRSMASSAPVEVVKASTCGADINHPGYESWGRRDAHSALVRCDDVVDGKHGDLCVGCYLARRRWECAVNDGREYVRRAR